MLKAYVNSKEKIVTIVEKENGEFRDYYITFKALYEAATNMTSIQNFFDYIRGHGLDLSCEYEDNDSLVKQVWEVEADWAIAEEPNFEFLFELVLACSDADENFVIDRLLIRVLENYFSNEEHITVKCDGFNNRYTLVKHKINNYDYEFVVDLTTNEVILYKQGSELRIICFKEKKLNRKELLYWLAGVTHKDTVEFIRKQALFSEASNHEFFIEGANVVEYNVAANGVEYEKSIYNSIDIHNALAAITSGDVTTTEEFFRTLYQNGTLKRCTEKSFTKPLSEGYTFKTLVKIVEFHYKNSMHYAENAEAYFNLHSYSLYRLSSLILKGYLLRVYEEDMDVVFAPNYVKTVAYTEYYGNCPTVDNRVYPVEAFVDFCSNAIITKVADLTIKTTQYESLEALVESLWNLDFEELTSIDEEELRKVEELVKINY